MNAKKRNPGEPIENLAIGTVIEVDGSRIIAELHPSLTELSRIFGGETYPIGQFGFDSTNTLRTAADLRACR